MFIRYQIRAARRVKWGSLGKPHCSPPTKRLHSLCIRVPCVTARRDGLNKNDSDFWRSILSMLEPTSRTSPDGQNGGPPMSDGLDAVFRRKSLRRPSGRAFHARKPSILVDTLIRVSRPAEKMRSITYFLSVERSVPPLVHQRILIAVRERWDEPRDPFCDTLARMFGEITTTRSRRRSGTSRKSSGFLEIAHIL